MANQKSNQYDWFKNGGISKDSNDFKKNPWKMIWKFTKIFLYLSLFVFSLVGCVQSFIIKSDGQVGRGLEIFANNHEVAPHSTTLNVNIVKNTSGQDKMYLEYADASHWINDNKLGIKVIGPIENALKVQNIAQNLKLIDAFKGYNEVLRLTKNHKPLALSGLDSIVKIGTKPAIISSSSIISDISWITEISDVNKILKGTGVWNSSKTRLTQIKFDISNGGFKTFFNKRTEYTRNNYILSLFEQTIKTLPQELFKPTLITTPGKNIVNKQDIIELNRTTNNFKLLTQYFNIFPVDKTAITKGFYFTSNVVPGAFSGASWRPLSTWSAAWAEGPFYGLFVYPIGAIAAKMINAMPFLSGWESLITIFIIVFVIRFLTFLISFKSILQQTKMQELQAKKSIIDAKYVNYKGNKQMENRQRQEVSELYKREGVSPLGSIGSLFLTMPLFLAIWRVTSALPHIKSTLWLGMNFSATSYKQLFSGEFQYLPLMILAASFAALQSILPRLLTKRRDKNRINVHQKAAMKKNNKTQNIIIIVMIVMSLIFTAGIQVYYIAGGLWAVIQAFVTHHIINKQSKKKKRIRS